MTKVFFGWYFSVNDFVKLTFLLELYFNHINIKMLFKQCIITIKLQIIGMHTKYQL